MASSHTAYIGLGSNLKNPLVQLKKAIAALNKLDDCAVDRCSPPYWSTAIGPGEQPDYLNAALRLQTQLDPATLLKAMQQIEKVQGRTRAVRWGARTLDLDLLLFDDLIINREHLTVPHPRLQERNFVVYPLHDLAPALRLPDGKMLSELVKQLPDTGLRLAEHAL